MEAYDEEGRKVWERELDIYGSRFQGQYEDEEIGLYYNRFRYYSPDDGCYTQQDPIGLAGGNPTLYAYVSDSNWWINSFGLINFANLTDSDILSMTHQIKDCGGYKSKMIKCLWDLAAAS